MAKLYTKTTWVDEILAGAEKYLVKNDAGTTVYSNADISLSTGVTVAGTLANATIMNNIETGIDAIDTKVTNINSANYQLIKVTNIFNGTVSYTPTTGARALYVECIGGGGAGGGAATGSSSCSLGGGGGAGAYSAVWLTSFSAPITVAVGAGGTAGSAGAAGNNGGDTTFAASPVCTAKGGTGGAVLGAGTSLLTQAGAAGGASASGVGDVKFDGSNGGWGVRLSAAAGHAGDGAPAPIASGIAGGANATLTAGSAGKLYGGGGSGAFTATTAQAGGAGANGLIRVWEFA